MSVTFGFYNSLNGDRRYDASAVSSIFDGLIVDGVFASIGTAFAVKAAGGLTVNVGIGKAWLNHTWTLNDAILPIELPESEVLLNRIDAIVIEVNSTEAVRENCIKVIQGVPASSPVRPTLVRGDGVYQYPLCYINRKFGTNTVTQSNIVNTVGTDELPFVVSVLKTISLDELLGRWEDELDLFLEERRAQTDSWIRQKESDFENWSDEQRSGFITWSDRQVSDFESWSSRQRSEAASWISAFKEDLLLEQNLLDEWTRSEQEDFLAWYNGLKETLSDDAAGNLQLQIDKESLKRILLTGFDDGEKIFSDDGTEIICTSSDGRILTKTFTENFSVVTTVLKSAQGAVQARMVKRFGTDGKTISTNVNYF